MQTVLRSLSRFTFLVASLLPVVASAHPGHDDSDFTWEFSHLAAHPGATALCFGSLIVSAAVAWYFVRRLPRSR
jgi:hypothetical protein